MYTLVSRFYREGDYNASMLFVIFAADYRRMRDVQRAGKSRADDFIKSSADRSCRRSSATAANHPGEICARVWTWQVHV